jgi:hypothetical protein
MYDFYYEVIIDSVTQLYKFSPHSLNNKVI